jgi:hypothetical protein
MTTERIEINPAIMLGKPGMSSRATCVRSMGRGSPPLFLGRHARLFECRFVEGLPRAPSFLR